MQYEFSALSIQNIIYTISLIFLCSFISLKCLIYCMKMQTHSQLSMTGTMYYLQFNSVLTIVLYMDHKFVNFIYDGS